MSHVILDVDGIQYHLVVLAGLAGFVAGWAVTTAAYWLDARLQRFVRDSTRGEQ